MAIGLSHTYSGHFSGWNYDGRAVGENDWDASATVYAPLAEAIEARYAAYVPYYGALGPRGCGYQLKGRIIPDGKGLERKVVKGNEGNSVPLLPGEKPADRLRHVVGMPVWTFADVGQLITALRRSRVSPIDWDDVEDGRTKSRIPNHETDLPQTLASHAKYVKPHLLKGQPRKPVLVVEAAGGLNFWETIAEPWSVSVHSSGGMGAVDLAKSLARQSLFQDLLIALVVDMDISGVGIADRLYEEVMAHPHGDIEWVLLGVDDALVARLGLDRNDGQTKGKPGTAGFKSLRYTAEAEQWTAEHPEDAKRVFDRLMWGTLDIRKAARYRWEFRSIRRRVLDVVQGGAS